MRTQNFSAAHAPSVGDLGPSQIPFSPSPAGKRDARTSDRQVLLAVAGELFSRHGFRCTTLARIARAARCSVNTIRREFGAKNKLLECVLQSAGPRKVAGCSVGSSRHSLREEICWLVEWEARRMNEHREYLANVLPQEEDQPEVTRIAGNLSFSSADVMAERLKRHRHLGEAERQFLIYAIQSSGFAIGFVQSESVEPSSVQGRIKQLADVLADSIERHDLGAGSGQFTTSSLLPI